MTDALPAFAEMRQGLIRQCVSGAEHKEISVPEAPEQDMKSGYELSTAA